MNFGRENYHEGMFKLVKRWDKCFNAYDGKINIYIFLLHFFLMF